YGAYRNTLASMYQANVKQAWFFARMRGFESTLEASLDSSNIPVKVYDNLINTVNRNLDKMHRYVALRKKVLGVEELHLYDVYAPLVKDYEVKVSYEEAKERVLSGLHPLGNEYQKILREGYDNGWIDVCENQGKRSGAFSWGAYGTHPYVFLNYQENLDNVFTLAHEMGHAIHTYLSNSNQPHVYAGYRIFVAEVASTCNEALLIRDMIEKSSNRQEKLYLLNHFMEQFKGTMFRQTMFAEFEKITHEMAGKGTTLTADVLCRVYRELNEKYFGPDMVIDEEIELEWSRIPHFYTPFYVYQYATGFAAAVTISGKILEEGKPAVDGYMEFLKSGSSDYPIEVLKKAGVDMESPEAVEGALEVFGELLDEFERLLEE
ncbi:MAG: oligoendopeptidase F, partial [Thermoflexaceae bacterium]|nr:oligoendopeptidase F [Thermoflexaceae bacterium]